MLTRPLFEKKKKTNKQKKQPNIVPQSTHTQYSVMRKVYTVYHVTSEIEQGRCACTVDNTLAKARGLSLRTGTQTMLNQSRRQCRSR